MGTNYYIRTSEEELIHLGKSSMGWKFSPLQGSGRLVQGEGIHTLVCADRRSPSERGQIEDEYGVSITKDELMEFIASKQGLRSHLAPRPDERAAWEKRGIVELYDRMLKSDFDCDGYDFCDAEFS